jgi:hypothetical protein
MPPVPSSKPSAESKRENGFLRRSTSHDAESRSPAGANLRFCPPDVEAAEEAMARADMLLLQL